MGLWLPVVSHYSTDQQVVVSDKIWCTVPADGQGRRRQQARFEQRRIQDGLKKENGSASLLSGRKCTRLTGYTSVCLDECKQLFVCLQEKSPQGPFNVHRGFIINHVLYF